MALQGAAYKGLILPKAPAPKPIVFPGGAKVKPTTEASKITKIPQPGTTLKQAATEARQFPKGPTTKAPREPGFQQPSQPAKSSSGGGSAFPLATILAAPGAAVTQGFANIAKATGVSAFNEIGKIPSEVVNLPTQAAVGAFYAGKGLGEATRGHPQELEQIGHEYMRQSAVAHVFKGEFGKALQAVGEHPVNTALEFTGVASLGDRLAGVIRDGGLLTRAPEGATVSREPRPLPDTAVPKGGVSIPQKPYSGGLARRNIEKQIEQRPVSEPKAAKALKQNFDQFEAEALHASRSDREAIRTAHAKLLRNTAYAKLQEKTPGMQGFPGIEATGHYASGLLADPKVLAKDGSPLYRQHLAEAIDHFSKAPKDELPPQAKQREEVRAHLVALNQDRAFHENPQRSYDVAKQIAARKAAQEPELAKHHVYTGDTMRITKLIKPFQFHFRDQNPFVDTTVPIHESPFQLNGRQVSVDEVARKLEAKGIHESQLSFASTKPFQSESAAFLSGRSAAGAKESAGHLTGHNYIRGVFDPAPEALTRAELKAQKVINDSRAQNEFNRRYPLKNTDLAKLIEGRAKTLTPGEQVALQRYADELKGQRNTYFQTTGTESAWTRARAAQQQLEHLGVHLEPVRVAHPYATTAYRQGMAEHLKEVADLQDRLEPELHGEEQIRTRLPPEAGAAATDMSSGPVALVHPTVAQKIKDYEGNLGKAHLLQLPGGVWRKGNVALSVRHPLGVSQEIAIRAAANNIGLVSGIRGTRFHALLKDFAENHPDPAVKAQWQRLEANAGGTHAGYASMQGKHIPLEQLRGTALEKPAKWWIKGEEQKITGAPLRGIRTVVKGMNKTTDAILHYERQYLERPSQVAGLGKHYAQEYQRLTGKRLKVVGAFKDVEKAFLQGRLDPKAIDHFANVSKAYWGDWKASPPGFRKAQAASPFLRWYTNSMRFIYHTMPKDHPIQTGLLATIESATREQRQTEGQEYEPILDLPKGKLPSYQQGSLPLGGKERYGFEYYSPPGAVSGGTESLIGALLPYATGLYNTLQGVDPLTHHVLEEKNPETGKKEPITDQGKLILKGILSGLETFVPPYRYATSLGKNPPGYVFRPVRTEKEHRVGATKTKAATGLGGSLGGSLGGGSLGGSLK